jgi:ABC-type multidrug transport system ATPase subunit
MILQADSLVHSYGPTRVLTGVYLRLSAGEVLGVVGRNGSGKTTMLRALLGTLHPDAMHLELEGDPVSRAYAHGLISLLPQEPYLPRRLRVARAISLALPDEASREAVRSHPRVSPHLRKKVSALSGGEQRILEVLIALEFPAAVVFLDEPFTEIEPIHRESVRTMIRKASHDHGRGIIVTDHAYRDVLATADRVQVLADGVLRDADGEEDLRRWGYTP